ncbi:hypothetical protein SDRG_16538 [Saprolegnia diclina VS20]|uniref:CBM1 domain-containing protein n=1 Tax=Saprolegnia diclina (strain VS20) TaxID=1156394 RepID=T0R7Y5_SAPDV|nr:hypothetical protein SDRG_16538 [Saprolegnia diclina VS20]EQC25607.1 hypothetical protein SDRG_16538 [Saprolegnia diclina VS20]|eukprot:XP_008620975.1 hypothetical protein SDRG_16538 [Saprolegnia diclina VS20]
MLCRPRPGASRCSLFLFPYLSTMKIASLFALSSSLANLASAAICAGVAPYSYQVAVQTDAKFAPAINELKKYPVATWYTDRGGDSIDALIAACPTDTPVIIVYGLPGKDCDAGYSGGGSNTNTDQYKAWLEKLTTKVGSRKVIYILEPDAIGLLANKDCAAQNGYAANLQVAIHALAANSNAQIYADVAGWANQGKAVAILKGFQKLTGIAINTSNYKSTGEMNQLCETYSSQTGGLHCIIDTSRNHNGSPQNEWCNAKSAGIGAPPTDNTGSKVVDYLLWLKVPGESDGQCYGQSSDSSVGPGAGQFFPDGFQRLWDQSYFVAHGLPKIGEAPSPSTQPAPSPSPSTASPTAAPTVSPTDAPKPSTPAPTDAPTPSTDAPTPSTDAPKPSTDAPKPSTDAPTPSTAYPTPQPSSSTHHPTTKPTKKPTFRPTTKPTKKPTFRPTTKPGTSVNEWEQCGGKSYHGSTACIDGCKCEFINEYYSQCRPVAASTSEVAPYGRCGGINYAGVTTCSGGYTCKVMNPHYSQCVRDTSSSAHDDDDTGSQSDDGSY